MDKKQRKLKKRRRDRERAQGVGDAVKEPTQGELIYFTITPEPMDDPDMEALPLKEQERLHDLLDRSTIGAAKFRKELERAVERYPQVRPLWNRVTAAASEAGDEKGFEDWSRRTYERFPDYIFGLTSYLMYHLNEGNLDAAADLVAGRLVITQVVPGRQEFHLTEYLAFERAIIHYLIATGKAKLAVARLDGLIELMKDHPFVKHLHDQVWSGWDGLLLALRLGEVESHTTEQAEERDEREQSLTLPPEALRDCVPPPLHERFDEMVGVIDQVCDEFLDEAYRGLARVMAVELCQEGTPATRGKPESWAAGVLHVLGSINFLSDSTFEPVMSLSDLADHCGVSPATGSNKAKAVRDLLGIEPFTSDSRWMLPELVDGNPLVWLVERPDGLLVDLRDAPRAVQEAAFKAGVIPFLPEDSSFR